MASASHAAPARFRLRLPTLLELGALIAFLFVVAPLVVVAGAALNSEAMAFPNASITPSAKLPIASPIVDDAHSFTLQRGSIPEQSSATLGAPGHVAGEA